MERGLSFPKSNSGQVTYFVYKENGVTTVKAYGFNIVEGTLVFTDRKNHIVRVFASGVWKEIEPEGEINDKGY